jgi:hypothetical protein
MNYTLNRLPDHSKESLIQELQRVAKILNKDTITQNDLQKFGRVGVRAIGNKFGSWNNALTAAGLKITREYDVDDEHLFENLKKIWDQKGNPPSYRDLKTYRSSYSPKRYELRFGSFTNALNEFITWNNAKETNQTQSDLSLIPNHESLKIPEKNSPPKKSIKKAEYGEPVDFRGLRHAPINEQGVVYLFGTISRELGFNIEAIRTDFPDCEGKREISGKKGRWEPVKIEFEYKSSNFKAHGHDPELCDIIVCWEDDWKDCPLEVISLKEKMKQLPQNPY